MPRQPKCQSSSSENADILMYELPKTRKRKINPKYVEIDDDEEDLVVPNKEDDIYQVANTEKLTSKSAKKQKQYQLSKPQESTITETVPVQNDEIDQESLSFFDLEPFDIFPEIFRHFELRDFLNFSLVSKRVYDLVSPKIVQLSKIVFKARPLSRKELLEVKSFKRKYDCVEIEQNYKNKTIEMMQILAKLEIFNQSSLIITIDDFKSELALLKKLKKIGGFAKLSIRYQNKNNHTEPEECHTFIEDIIEFDTRNFNKLVEFSKLQENLNIKDLTVTYFSGDLENSHILLPKLEVLRISNTGYTSKVEKIIRQVLSGQCNHLTQLSMTGFTKEETIHEILKASAATLNTIELRYYTKGFSLLPAKPKKLTITSSMINIAAIDMSIFLSGQTNLEVLHLRHPLFNEEILNVLVENQNLWNFQIDNCDFLEKTLHPKYIPIFSRLRKLSFSGPSHFFDLIVNHLDNVSDLTVNSSKRGENSSYKNTVQIPHLKNLTLKGSGRGLLVLFKNSIVVPDLKSIDIEYSKKQYIDVKSLGEFNKTIKFLKIRNWLYPEHVKQVLRDFTNLDSLIFKATDFSGLLEIIKTIYESGKHIKYLNITVYDWNRQFLQLHEALETVFAGIEVKGSIKGTCVAMEIFFEDTIVINIEKSLRKQTIEDI